MVSFGRKKAKRFKARAQVISGRRTRIGLVVPGIRRTRRRITRAPEPNVQTYGTV